MSILCSTKYPQTPADGKIFFGAHTLDYKVPRKPWFTAGYFSVHAQSLMAIATGINPVAYGEPLSAVSVPNLGSIVYADTVLEFEFAA
jgi:hypothetical protein